MKKSAFAALALSLVASSAFAADRACPGAIIEVYQCTQLGIVAGNSVHIQNRMGCGGLTADISNAKGDLLRSVVVKQVPVPAGRMGAPRTFKGKSFELVVHVDGTPVMGGSLADLVAEVNGAKVNERLVCRALR